MDLLSAVVGLGHPFLTWISAGGNARGILSLDSTEPGKSERVGYVRGGTVVFL